MASIDNLLRRYAWYRKWRGLPEPMSVRMCEITREAIRIAHESASFIDTINREYLAPTGDTLRIRKPVQYVKRSEVSNG